MGKDIIKKEINLEGLPKWENCQYRGIKWGECVGRKVHFKYDNIEGEVIISNYTKKNQILTIDYNNSEFRIDTGHFCECKFGKMIGKITSSFRVNIGDVINSNNRDLIIIDRKREKDKTGRWWKYYRYKCQKCGFECGEYYSTKDKQFYKEYWIEENHLLSREQGCSCCSNQIVVEGINDIPTTAPWMIKYFQGGYDEAKKYHSQSNQKVNFKCPDCGKIKNKTLPICELYKRNSISCSYCGDGLSYPEKFMFNILKQLNVDFETEKKFKWCKYKFKNKMRQGRYDFYIPSMNLIIEMDGGWHYKDNSKSGQTKEESEFIDNEKNRLAREHDIEIIRIDCNYEYKKRTEWIIKYVLNSKLNELYDLSNIDWNIIERNSLNNRVKEVCKLWRNRITSTKEIEKIVKLDRGTVIKYLKQGTKLGWCDYDPKEESIKTSRKDNIKNGKKLICINEGFNYIFNSTCECHRESLDIFEVELSDREIAKVCRGNRKSHKGFVFKYIQDLTPEEYTKYDIENKLKELECE